MGRKILGAIVGDMVGSTREWKNVKTEDFELLPKGSRFTDDTVMTLAVALWLMTDPMHGTQTLIECMQFLGRRYPNARYGGMFGKWLREDDPQPYNSFGNGSAMRVSPVGLYADTLEEALELARITASVSHNHPEGIKGAQAIAACVFMHKNQEAEYKIRHYIKETFGYELDTDLKEVRDSYTFDVTCQGSVPIAIMAYLQGFTTEDKLRLAISMGGDSDTIGAMTCSIAMADPFYIYGGGLNSKVEKQCRELLTSDLLEINDRFIDFISRPLRESYYLGGSLFAGEYPGDKYGQKAEEKIKHMLHFGVRHFVDLTEEGELKPYSHLLPKDATYMRFPIRDCGAPESVAEVQQLILHLNELQKMDGYTYLHCWGGVGRTGTVVACYLAQKRDNPELEGVLDTLRRNFAQMPKSSRRQTPETREQLDFIARFVDSSDARRQEQRERVNDSIRGCLMAGAAGDALGYEVEFMSRGAILSRYGQEGITRFALDSNGKAQISDDTQMTLFTANGMLMGLTRGYMRGIGGRPEKYVDGAYIDWYTTQTNEMGLFWKHTWLRDLPEMAHRRAPGNTCMNACASMIRGKEVQNNSKGCGGIMRVAPMALLDAGYASRDEHTYSLEELAEAGGEIAESTHKHPLGFLPAALLTVLIYKVVPLSPEQVMKSFFRIAAETLDVLGRIYKGKYEADKRYLYELSQRALNLAKSDVSDAEAVRQLGEGWTGEEAWAIALYCAARHIDSVEKAIIASVNHDGDSDSTGSITGNIMGAIYGYRHINDRSIFCPDGCGLEQTLELSEIILALADDLSTGCIISEYDPIDTPQKQQWYERYCKMEPAGIGGK